MYNYFLDYFWYQNIRFHELFFTFYKMTKSIVYLKFVKILTERIFLKLINIFICEQCYYRGFYF